MSATRYDCHSNENEAATLLLVDPVYNDRLMEVMEMGECGVWHANTRCPNCRADVDPEVRAAETGFRYCSVECARRHVNETQTRAKCDNCGERAEVQH